MLIFNLIGKFGCWIKRFLLNFKVFCDIDINYVDKFGKMQMMDFKRGSDIID